MKGETEDQFRTISRKCRRHVRILVLLLDIYALDRVRIRADLRVGWGCTGAVPVSSE